ncbi:hypothetical protein [Neobacillus niacini]|uniref:hypothetical protein n=1 Tax=Neobacillus niacini TaxID=86668 RepID=UPI0028567C9B|nr:hypothetical protein [Neobacillus niacini]MDR7000712.1 hypothetical protein [Neobacillus niacini]
MDELKLYAHCLQGDVIAAYEYLRLVPNKNAKFQELEWKYYQRFFCENPNDCFKSEDVWIQKVLSVYYQYFRSVLTHKSVIYSENRLRRSLSDLIHGHHQDEGLDWLEERLSVQFKEKGFEFVGGVTPPYRGPYIWKTTTEKKFTVELPHHTQEVTVYFLSDFILQSWAHYATFGEKFAGGWAKPDGLYYVADRPEHKKENQDCVEFQISYLKHEAQHLSDFSRFPHLQAKDLEYRAKLVELIYEPNSFRLINKFFYEKKNDPFLPHSYSSLIILKRLSKWVFEVEEIPSLEQWESVKSNSIQEWARSLFEEHTVKIMENGVQTRGII